MTLVLTGVTGFRNRGVEALVRAAIDGFARHLPGEPVAVLTTDPQYDRLALDETATVVADAPRYFRSGRFERYLRQIAATVGNGGSSRPAIEVLKTASAVVASGGDVFSSDYGMLRRLIGILEIACAFRKPVIFLAHSIGPFRTEREVSAMRSVLERAALITVRESRSRHYLLEELRIPPDRVSLTADVAFLLEPAPPERIAGLLRWLGLSASGGYAVLAPSEGITSFSSTRDRLAHDGAWVRTIRHILASSTSDILIVPHVQDVRPSNDDRRIASRLVEATGFDPRVRVAAGELSASDFKGLIKGGRYLIGERMHACIAALSSAVPTVAVGYSVKAQGIMADFLGGQAGCDGFHVPVSEFIASDGLVAEIDALSHNGEAARQRLAEAAAEARTRADANFTLTRDVLGRGVKAAA